MENTKLIYWSAGASLIAQYRDNGERVCYITSYGRIKWYVGEDRLEKEDIDKINEIAHKHRADFEEKLNKMTEIDKYCYMSDMIPDRAFTKITEMTCTLEEKVELTKRYLYGEITL